MPSRRLWPRPHEGFRGGFDPAASISFAPGVTAPVIGRVIEKVPFDFTLVDPRNTGAGSPTSLYPLTVEWELIVELVDAPPIEIPDPNTGFMVTWTVDPG